LTKTSSLVTVTDVGAAGWRMNDEPILMRVWGTDHRLPLDLDKKAHAELVIGRGARCAFRLVDPSRKLSRRHAVLSREAGAWILRDHESKNGLLVDGVPASEIVLRPGLVIGIGGLSLIVESLAFSELRAYMSRLIGFSADRMNAVDHALRTVRFAALRLQPIVLSGAGDLAALARDLHRHVLGDKSPFVMCDPGREAGEENVRAAENFDRGVAAVQAATGGTVCLWANRLPRDFKAARELLVHPNTRVQQIICTHDPADGKPFKVEPIVIPPLTTRPSELIRIVMDYASDARARLEVRGGLSTLDREWILASSATTLPEIEKGTLRVLAIRSSPSPNAAAKLLDMQHSSLMRWLASRPPLPQTTVTPTPDRARSRRP